MILEIVGTAGMEPVFEKGVRKEYGNLGISRNKFLNFMKEKIEI